MVCPGRSSFILKAEGRRFDPAPDHSLPPANFRLWTAEMPLSESSRRCPLATVPDLRCPLRADAWCTQGARHGRTNGHFQDRFVVSRGLLLPGRSPFRAPECPTVSLPGRVLAWMWHARIGVRNQAY